MAKKDEFELILQKKLQQARDEWATLPLEEKAKWTQKDLLAMELAVAESVHRKWCEEQDLGLVLEGPLDPRHPYVRRGRKG